MLNEKCVRKIKDKNYLLLAYTVNDRRRANVLFDMGVDSVFLDDPLLLHECILSSHLQKHSALQ